MRYYAQEIDKVYDDLKTGEHGLKSLDVQQRLQKHGPNEIKETKKISPVKIFLDQFMDFIIWILIGATIISFVIGETVDAIVILIILIINAILGFVQEYKAEKAIEALKKLTSLKATVLRDGKEVQVGTKDLVPGDIIILEEGSKVPADARLVSLANMEIDESALTGESTPVTKYIRTLDEKTALAERINMIFSGTIVTKGKGKAVVTGTGMETEIGRIAKMIQETDDKQTPLQMKLDRFGKMLGYLVLAICFVVFIIGYLSGEGTLMEVFLAAVALAVAAVPEGLPAVVTISLGLGVQRMVKKKALVRKLASVETLGSTTVICTDKTGTLTLNKMTVEKMYVNDRIIDVSGLGYSTEGKFSVDGKEADHKVIELILSIGALCNDASIQGDQQIGDPTEVALIVSAAKAGIFKDALNAQYPRKDELPFDSVRKIMTTEHEIKGARYAYTKGAPDELLKRCAYILKDGTEMRISEADKQRILGMNEQFANKALRVLGFAYKKLTGDLNEQSLTFVGLQGMIDLPREEAKQAIGRCATAGIKVVMITGDHVLTAKAVAEKLGLKGKAMTGHDIDASANIDDFVEDVNIYARVSPKHKVRIVEALQRKGHIVAMTGDGVNDAPALKMADIGVCVGSGTDVAKEASKMVLMDDNFASIVNAVEEGRNIYDNIKKSIFYLLSCNTGEVLTIFVAILMKFSLPLLAIQILWMNLVTDGLPALALAVDPPAEDIMKRKPRNPKEYIITRMNGIFLVIVGVVMMIGTLYVFRMFYDSGMEYARTMAFTTIVLFQMVNIFNTRSDHESAFRHFFRNRWLWGAIAVSLLLHFMVVYSPLSSYFKTVPLGFADLGISLGIAASLLVVGEIVKMFMRKYSNRAEGTYYS